MHRGLSIIITYYNGERFIFRCIDSIISSFGVSNKTIGYEIVIVIDSIDDADHIEILLSKRYESVRLLIIKNIINLGVSEARNVGLNHISNKFYTVLDQDDFVKRDYFPALEKELDDNCAVHIINGTINYTEKNIEIPMYFFAPGFDFNSILFKKTIFYTPGLLIFNSDFVPPQKLFIDASAKYKGCDDWAAYLNFLLNSKDKIRTKYIPQLLFVYCLHDANYSSDVKEMIQSSIAVLDFLKSKPNLSNETKRALSVSCKMHDFYLTKDINSPGFLKLFLNYPTPFLSHYLFSFFNMQRINRLFFRIRLLKKSLLSD